MATLKPKDWRRIQVAETAAALTELHSDLAVVNDWLAANGDALARAGGCTPSVNMPFPDKAGDVRLRVTVQCADRQALAAVTRILLAGAGKGAVRKVLAQNCQVARRFGRVEVSAWIAREKVCTPLTGTMSGWDCAAFLAEPLLPGEAA